MLFVGLGGGRHKEHAVEAGLFAAAFGGQQVADVHRIEAAAKHTNSHGWFLLSPRASSACHQHGLIHGMSHQHTSQRSLFESGPQWAEDDARQGVIATVVLPDGIEKPLDYLVPEPLVGAVEPGRRVLVPLGRGNRERLAYCVGVRSGELPQTPLKSVAAVEDDAPLLSRRMLDLTKWMADRWMARWGEVLEAVLPAGVRLRRKGRAVPLLVATGVEPARTLTPAQARVVAAAATPATADALAQAAGASRAIIARLLKTGLLREEGSVDRPHGRQKDSPVNGTFATDSGLTDCS